MKALMKILVAVALTIATGFGAMLFAGPASLQWYDTLHKPLIMPPLSIFFVAWVALYVLMTIALGHVWVAQEPSPEREGWIRFYFIQVLFNAAWILFFFGLHAILVAFIDMLFLAFIVSALIAGAWEEDRKASFFLMPYFLFALIFAFLNLNIWFLN